MQKKSLKKLYFSLLIIPVLFGIMMGVFLWYFSYAIFGYNILSGLTIILAVLGVIILFGIVTRSIIKHLPNPVGAKKKFRILHFSLGLGMVICTILSGFIVIPDMTADTFNSGPVITWGSSMDPQTEVMVIWHTETETDSSVIYGTDSATLTQRILGLTPTTLHQIHITDLLPGTKYYYRVENIRQDKVYSFITAPAGEDNFTFLALSDVRQNSGRIGMLLERSVPKYMVNFIQAQKLEVAFTLCAGDTIAAATDSGMWRSWYRDISVTSDLASNAPLQIAIGNHERHGDCEGTRFSEEYPYQARPQFYYSFNYSSTHFQVLDPWNITDCEWGEIDAAQLAWAQSDLTNASFMKFKVIALHPPPVYNSTVVEGMETIAQLCEDYDIDLVYYGHWHEFGYWNLNGTHYLLNGVGGNNNPRANPSGFVQVDVSSTEMSIKMNWLNGTQDRLASISA